MQTDAEVAGLVVVGGLVVVAFLIIDFIPTLFRPAEEQLSSKTMLLSVLLPE